MPFLREPVPELPGACRTEPEDDLLHDLRYRLPHGRLGPCVLGATTLDEGREALKGIARGEDLVERIELQLEARGEVCGPRAVQQAAGQPDRNGRGSGERLELP